MRENEPRQPTETSEERAAERNHLYAEQIRLLFRFSLVGFLASLLVLLLLGAILWDDLSSSIALFMWFVVASIVTIGRYSFYKMFFRHERPSRDMPTWEAAFIVGTTLMGLCWLMLGTFLLPDTSRMVQRISVVMLLMLLTTGAVAYYAPHRYAYKIVAVLGLLPIAITLAIAGGRVHLFLSGFIILLAIVLPFVHGRIHRALTDSLSQRRIKEHLAQQLAAERGRLQEVNEALAEEMLERLKAQQSELVAAQKVRLHFERTPLAVIEWDRQHRVTAWNPAAEAIFGFSVSEALGHAMPSLL